MRFRRSARVPCAGSLIRSSSIARGGRNIALDAVVRLPKTHEPLRSAVIGHWSLATPVNTGGREPFGASRVLGLHTRRGGEDRRDGCSRCRLSQSGTAAFPVPAAGFRRRALFLEPLVRAAHTTDSPVIGEASPGPLAQSALARADDTTAGDHAYGIS